MLTRYFSIGAIIALIGALLFGAKVGGTLFSILLGFMAGNYACSLIHRLPRGKAMLEHTPYCGECAHPLNEKDLLPVFGVLLLKFKCRYCSAPIPTSHFWTEVLLGLLFALAFLIYGFSQQYVLIAGLGTFLVVLSCIELNDKLVMDRMMVVVAVFGMLWRTLADAGIFDFFLGGMVGLIVGAALWRKEIKPVRHVYSFPPGARLMAMAGICVGMNHFPVFLLLYAVCWLLTRGLGKRLLAAPIAAAIMLTLLFDPGAWLTLLLFR